MSLPEDRRIPEEKFPEKVRRFVAADAPPQMRMMCARGMVPMPPVVQYSALCQLAHMGDADLSNAARETLLKQPRNVTIGVAKEPMLPVVLDWLAELFVDADDVLEALIQNKQTDDETVTRLAGLAHEHLTEIIALNQARLARSATIVEALYYNPNTRASTADRVVDFAARNGVDLMHLPGFDAVLAAIRGEQLAAKPDDVAKADAAFRDAHQAVAQIDAAIGDNEDHLIALHDLDTAPETEEVKKSRGAAAKIRNLSVPAKVRLALLGNKTERAILVKDANKLVSRAVITSPALSLSEISAFANNRNLPDEILSYIARSRQMTRNYRVKLNLAMNPKTPVGFALNFLRQLRDVDVRHISKNKNVSGPISKAAKDMVKAKA